MSTVAAAERAALADALRGVSPDAPTLCEGWDARDLAIHIVTRDSRPDAMIGKSLPLVGKASRRALEAISDLDYSALIERVAAGPQGFAPTRIGRVDDLVNASEFYVHTEDVLRAQPDFEPEAVREIPERTAKALWRSNAETMFRVNAHRRRDRITYLSPGYGAVTLGRPNDPLVTVKGDPGEVVLWAYGRREVAQVSVTTA